jgi:hypothetical protein
MLLEFSFNSQIKRFQTHGHLDTFFLVLVCGNRAHSLCAPFSYTLYIMPEPIFSWQLIKHKDNFTFTERVTLIFCWVKPWNLTVTRDGNKKKELQCLRRLQLVTQQSNEASCSFIAASAVTSAHCYDNVSRSFVKGKDRITLQNYTWVHEIKKHKMVRLCRVCTESARVMTGNKQGLRTLNDQTN